MEVILHTDIEKCLPAVIDFNFEQLKSELSEKLKFYNSLVVTENEIKSAKEDRARLNRMKTAFDEKRKEIKKQWNAPYMEFEKKAKELVALIDEPIAAIDAQTKAFEQAETDKKYALICEFYANYVNELKELVPLEKIINPKWPNKGTSLAVIEKELQESLSKIRNDIKVIKAMRLSCETKMLDAYFISFDMGDALREKQRFEEQEEKIKALEKVSSEPSETPAPSHNASFTTLQPEAQADCSSPYYADGEDLKDIKVVFYGTTTKFRQEMRALTEKHGIQYGGIR